MDNLYSVFSQIISTGIDATLIIVVAGLGGLVFLYFRWRRQQLQQKLEASQANPVDLSSSFQISKNGSQGTMPISGVNPFAVNMQSHPGLPRQHSAARSAAAFTSFVYSPPGGMHQGYTPANGNQQYSAPLPPYSAPGYNPHANAQFQPSLYPQQGGGVYNFQQQHQQPQQQLHPVYQSVYQPTQQQPALYTNQQPQQQVMPSAALSRPVVRGEGGQCSRCQGEIEASDCIYVDVQCRRCGAHNTVLAEEEAAKALAAYKEAFKNNWNSSRKT